MAKKVMEAEARITAVDKTGGVLARIAGKLKDMAKAGRAANATLAASFAAQRRQRAAVGGAMQYAADNPGYFLRYGPPAAAGLVAFKATKSALSLEKSLYEVGKALDLTGPEIKQHETYILDLARASGKTKEELAGMMAAAGFAGRPKDEVVRFTEFAAKATGAWGTSAAETGDALAQLGNIYQASQERIESIGDAIDKMADVSASKETDLLEFIRRTGATAKMLGISAERTLAFGAAMKEVGVQSEVAATGMNAFLGYLAADKDDEDTAEKFKEAGINLKKFAAIAKKDATKAAVVLLEHFAKIGDGAERLRKLEKLFGKEYADDIAKLTNNLPRLRELLKVADDSKQILGSVSRSAARRLETDVSRLERAQQSIDVLMSRSGNGMKIAAGAVAEGINKIVEAVEKGETVFDQWEQKRRAYNRERYGSDESPNEAVGRAVGQPEQDAINDAIAGPWGQNPILMGGYADASDAAAAGRREAERERRKQQDIILRRPGELTRGIEQERAKLSSSPRKREAQERMIGVMEGELANAQESARRVNQLLADADRKLSAQYDTAEDARRRGAASMADTRRVPLPPPRPPEFGGKVAATLEQPIDVTGKLTAVVEKPVDVTGKVEAEIKGEARVAVTIKVDGPGQVVGMSGGRGGNVSARVGSTTGGAAYGGGGATGKGGE